MRGHSEHWYGVVIVPNIQLSCFNTHIVIKTFQCIVSILKFLPTKQRNYSLPFITEYMNIISWKSHLLCLVGQC